MTTGTPGEAAPTAPRRDPYEGFAGRVGRTFAESEPAWPARTAPPAKAPNIVVVLVDDMGFSDIGPFGSEIPTPVLDALADDGVRLTNYHTMPLCSPARAALLTGLNPHRVGYAMVANSDPGFPGYGMEIADDIPTLAELLHDAGCATYAVGKWHLVRDSASNAADHRGNWPLQKGFDQYYGVLEGLTSLFHPHQLVRDNSPLDIDEFPDDYYYTDDITDQAISMVKCCAPTTPTSPSSSTSRTTPSTAPPGQGRGHRPPPGPLRRGLGRPARAALRRPARRRALPARHRTPRPQRRGRTRRARLGLPHRGAAAALRPLHGGVRRPCRQHRPEPRPTHRHPRRARRTRQHHRRLHLRQRRHRRGRRGGHPLLLQPLRPPPPPPRRLGPGRRPRPRADRRPPQPGPLPARLGHGLQHPFRLYKGHTYAGGVRVPFVLSWPEGVRDGRLAAGLRPQYQYVTDIAPTLLELAGLARPESRRGVPSRSRTASASPPSSPTPPTTPPTPSSTAR